MTEKLDANTDFVLLLLLLVVLFVVNGEFGDDEGEVSGEDKLDDEDD